MTGPRARGRWFGWAMGLLLLPAPAAATDWTLFPAVENVTAAIVAHINAETVRIDMAAWYLTEHAISIALVNRFRAGVPVRLIGDRVSIFESDPLTRREFYWLAAQGVPIRLRYTPTWQPEIAHWKATVFAGQGMVTFGSANYTPFELAPVSATNYKDEVVTFTDDPEIVNAFRTRFDRMWNDTTAEPRSVVAQPPYLMNWSDACAREPACTDFAQLYPDAPPMLVTTARLEPDHPSPPDLLWGQGPEFNQRLIQEIGRETVRVDLVAYRLTAADVADALIQKFHQGVPVRVIIEPEQYTSRVWPEYWLTHFNVDRLWAAGIPIRQRAHDGLTHMKVLITSAYATNASSNIATNWQRDHNWFASASTHPAAYQALRSRFEVMWNDAAGFVPFSPQPADAPSLAVPTPAASGVPRGAALEWRRAPFATSYDVYVGVTPDALAHVATVPAVLSLTPPATYSWTPPILQSTTRYYWRVVSRTVAGLATASAVRSFETALWQRAGDFDGDGLSDLTVWRPSTGVWWTRTTGTGAVSAAPWGAAGDRPVSGDYDGDGKADVAIFRPSTGTWHIVNSSTGAPMQYAWGTATDRPVPGDYDGDRRVDVAVFRPSSGTWHILQSSTGTSRAMQWGDAADIPVPADYDGDGRADIAVFRPADGRWYVVSSATLAVGRLQWGASGDVPVPADYDGDGRADPAVFRPGTGTWYLLYTASNAVWAALRWGDRLDIPVPGDYDGDGRADIAVFRPSTGWWHVLTADGTNFSAGWGISTDVPLPTSP